MMLPKGVYHKRQPMQNSQPGKAERTPAMPIGGFLDSFPKALFIAAHMAFLVIGLWAIMRARNGKQAVAAPLWLYIASQPVFLLFFGGAITLKMAVLTEQTLMVVMVIWMALQTKKV